MQGESRETGLYLARRKYKIFVFHFIFYFILKVRQKVIFVCLLVCWKDILTVTKQENPCHERNSMYVNLANRSFKKGFQFKEAHLLLLLYLFRSERI